MIRFHVVFKNNGLRKISDKRINFSDDMIVFYEIFQHFKFFTGRAVTQNDEKVKIAQKRAKVFSGGAANDKNLFHKSMSFDEKDCYSIKKV